MKLLNKLSDREYQHFLADKLIEVNDHEKSKGHDIMAFNVTEAHFIDVSAPEALIGLLCKITEESNSYAIESLRKVARAIDIPNTFVGSANKSNLMVVIKEEITKLYKTAQKAGVTDASFQVASYFLDDAEEAEVAEVIEEAKTTTNSNDLADVLARALGSRVKADVDYSKVADIVKKELNKLSKTVTISSPEYDEKELGVQHKSFEDVLSLVNAGLNVWLFGGAGSGKTHLAESIASALNIDFYGQSVSSQTTKSDLIGYKDANGNYQESGFYKMYKHGGLFLLDEVDSGNANVLTTLNAATSNGAAFFYGEEVKKHKDFRLIACANTIGDGANRQYIGRNALDGATKDRFFFYHLDNDWKLIKTLCYSKFGNDFTENYWDDLTKIRTRIEEKNIKNIMFTPRTVLNFLNTAKNTKLPKKLVFEGSLFKGCDDTTKQQFSDITK